MEIPDRLPDQSWYAVVEPADPEEVKNYLIDEIFKALGMRADSLVRAAFGLIFSPLVTSLAHQAVEFDEHVARQGFQLSAQELMKKMVTGLQVSGEEYLPNRGPLLIAANHPGTYDGLAISSVITRQDLRMVAAANPFFRALPNIRDYFVYSTRDTHVRMVTIRNAIRHLQSGGALLIFPSGRLDPDPLHFKEAARQALSQWSASLKFILTKVPQTNLVIAINSGFVAPEQLRNPLVRLQPNDERKQKLAEFIQIIEQLIFKRRISIQPGIFFSGAMSSTTLFSDVADFQSQITENASKLMDQIPSSR